MQMIAGVIVVLAGAGMFTAGGFAPQKSEDTLFVAGAILGIVGFVILFTGMSRSGKNPPPKG